MSLFVVVLAAAGGGAEPAVTSWDYLERTVSIVGLIAACYGAFLYVQSKMAPFSLAAQRGGTVVRSVDLIVGDDTEMDLLVSIRSGTTLRKFSLRFLSGVSWIFRRVIWGLRRHDVERGAFEILSVTHLNNTEDDPVNITCKPTESNVCGVAAVVDPPITAEGGGVVRLRIKLRGNRAGKYDLSFRALNAASDRAYSNRIRFSVRPRSA